jgi:hypothetical protein
MLVEKRKIMRTKKFYTTKATLLSIAIFFAVAVTAQQHIIQDKNNTRPEITRKFSSPPAINPSAFFATQHNGYNEIRWSAGLEQDTRKYIVEYSTDGIYYQSAGEIISTTGHYLLKHQTFEIAPMLYRLRIEDLEGRSVYSQNILLQGIGVSPVKIYPTIITGNTVNVIAGLPVERIAVYAGNGQQVFAKEISGNTESISVVLPSLGKGMYWMHFMGQGWKTTSQFIVP